MSFAALAPAVSHALASAGATAWVEVCTAQGMRWVAIADEALSPAKSVTSVTPAEGEAGKPMSPAAKLAHCPACTLASDDLAPPPAVPALLPLPLQRAGPPPRFEQAPRTAHAWLPAQARAPPARG